MISSSITSPTPYRDLCTYMICLGNREQRERTEHRGPLRDPSDLSWRQRTERADRAGPKYVKEGKVYEAEDSLLCFLSFVLNLVVVSSVQNLTAINHDSTL
jgi:hypothetical protein